MQMARSSSAQVPQMAGSRVVKPAVLSVDDDPEVLRTVARDLRRQYSAQYRVLSADSGAAALSTLEELKRSDAPWRYSW